MVELECWEESAERLVDRSDRPVIALETIQIVDRRTRIAGVELPGKSYVRHF